MSVTVQPDGPAGHRRVPLLQEPDLGHYPEFARFFADRFGLHDDPLGAPGVVSVDGRHYELVFIGRSGRPFPAAVELNALVEGLEPLDIRQADRDLLEIMGWMLDQLGPPWSADGLTQTGRIFRITALDPPGDR